MKSLFPQQSDYLLSAPNSALLQSCLKETSYVIFEDKIYFLIKKNLFQGLLPVRFVTESLIILEQMNSVELNGSYQIIGEVDGISKNLLAADIIPDGLKPIEIETELVEPLQYIFDGNNNKTLKNELKKLNIAEDIKTRVRFFWGNLAKFNNLPILKITDPVLENLVYSCASQATKTANTNFKSKTQNWTITLMMNSIAKIFVREFKMINVGRVLYMFVPQINEVGCYQEVRRTKNSQSNILFDYFSKTLDILQQHFAIDPSVKINFPTLNKKTFEEFLFHLENIAKTQKINPDNWSIVFKNVILDFSNYKNNLEPEIISPTHQNNYKILSQIPHYFINFNPSNEQHQLAKKRVDDYLNSLFIGEDNQPDQNSIKAFWEAIGFSAFDNAKLRKMFIFTGKGRNGKSTLFEFIRRIFGTDNVAELSYDQVNDKFNLSQLRNKKVNFSDELPDYLALDTGILKSIIAGSPITTEDKFEKPTEWSNTATMFAATNHQIKFQKYSEAVKDRIYFFELKGRFDKKTDKKNIIEEVYENPDATLSYIFSQMIEGIKRAIQNNFTLTDSNPNSLLILSLQRENNKLLDYLIEKSYFNISDPINKISYTQSFDNLIKEFPIRELFIKYKQWCEEEYGSSGVILKTFRNEILDLFPLKKVLKTSQDGTSNDYFQVDEILFNSSYTIPYQEWIASQNLKEEVSNE